MLKRFAGPLLVLLGLSIAGCAGSMDTPSAVNLSAPTAQAGGSWSGYAGVGAAAAPVALTLRQSGGTVTGNIDVAGRPDLTGAVVGTVQGNGLSLKMQDGYGSLPLMTVTQDQISGVIALGPMTLRRVK
jgi:hypothetical protein